MRILLFTAILALSSLSCTGGGGGSSSTSRSLRFQHYLKAAHPGTYDSFGTSIAISGDTMVIGASGESSAATGVNGDQTNNDAWQSGAVYVFRRSGSGWVQEAYLKASNTQVQSSFGRAVAISGNVIAVGAYHESSAATGINGDQNNADAEESGAVYIFRRTTGIWTQEAYLKASNTAEWDYFGSALALSDDTLAVGAPGEDKSSSGVNGDQHTSDPLTAESGAVYVFRYAEGTWAQEAYIKASDPHQMADFGSSIALLDETLAIGSPGARRNPIDDNITYESGSAYIFTRSEGAWSQRAYLKASNFGEDDEFGSRVAMAGDALVISAPGEDSSATGVNGAQNLNDAWRSGAVYVFRGVDDTWTQEAYLKASNTGSYDRFGASLSISGNSVLIGATGESSNAVGIGGDQSNDDLEHSGAAYLFRRTAGGWAQSAYIKAPNSGFRHGFGRAAFSTDTVLVIASPSESNSALHVPGEVGSGAAYVYDYRSGSLPSAAPAATAVLPLGNG